MTEFEFSEERRSVQSVKDPSSSRSLIFLVQKLHLAKTERQATILLIIIMILAFILGFYVLYITFFNVSRDTQLNTRISPELRDTIPDNLVTF